MTQDITFEDELKDKYGQMAAAYERVTVAMRMLKPVREVMISTPHGNIGFKKFNGKWQIVTQMATGMLPLLDAPVLLRLQAAEYIPSLYDAIVESLQSIPSELDKAVRILLEVKDRSSPKDRAANNR